ncbi:MAG: hypothetical protein Q7S66_00995 [bacterium]|nr:hypothetical protein [bacterium]
MTEGREQPPMPEPPKAERVEFSSPLIKNYGEQVTTALTGADSKFVEAQKLIVGTLEKTDGVSPAVGIEATKIQEEALGVLAAHLRKLAEDIDGQITIMRKGRIYTK